MCLKQIRSSLPNPNLSPRPPSPVAPPPSPRRALATRANALPPATWTPAPRAQGLGRAEARRPAGTEYNTDHDTHSLVAGLMQQGLGVDLKLRMRLAPPGFVHRLDARDVETRIYPALTAEVAKKAELHAARACLRADDEKRWSSPASLARVYAEVLLDNDFRRGPLPSEPERARRESQIKEAMASADGLRFAVLLLPLRDRNPAKNDGPLPDLGEVGTLLRLSTLARAMSAARTAFLEARAPIFAELGIADDPKAGLEAIFAPTETAEPREDLAQTVAVAQDEAAPALAEPRDDGAQAVADPRDDLGCWAEVFAEAKRIGREGGARLNKKLYPICQALGAYRPLDVTRAAEVVLALARAGKSFAWLWEAAAATAAETPKIVAVRDAHRYRAYDTDPEADIEAYRRAIHALEGPLALAPGVEITSHEEQAERLDPAALADFERRRDLLYAEKEAEYLAPFSAAREHLLTISDRDAFRAAAQEIDPKNGAIAGLIETILHGRYSPALAARSAEAGDPGRFTLEFLASIFTPRKEEQEEALRKEVLWEAVRGAVQYIASYEANTAGANRFALDDLALLVPNHVRMSIHKKPEDRGQFTIIVGPSVHRTPWHGTAAIHDGTRGPSLETKLSLELKHEGYVPVLITGAQEGHLAALAAREQPYCWLSPDLAARLEPGHGLAELVEREGLKL